LRVTILKYFVPAFPISQEWKKNYFENEINVIDRFVFPKVLKDSFPIFVEEWEDQEDINTLKTGFFDLTLSLGFEGVSEIQHQSLKYFFSDGSSVLQEYHKFIVICETSTYERSYCGVIDPLSISFDESFNLGNNTVTFSVYGIEQEAVSYLKGGFLGMIGNDSDFENNYLPEKLISQNDLIQIESRLALTDRIGVPIRVGKDLHNRFVSERQDNGQIFTRWDAFKSFMVGFGFKFKIQFNGFLTNGKPRFKFILFFKSKGLNLLDLTAGKFLSVNRGLLEMKQDRVLMYLYASQAYTYNGEAAKQYQGFIIEGNNRFFYEGGTSGRRIIYSPKADYYFTSDGRGYSAQDVKVVKLDLWDFTTNNSVNQITFCYTVWTSADDGLLRLWRYIAEYELSYLSAGVKPRKNIKLKVPETLPLILGSVVKMYRNENVYRYFCERITDYDNFNQTIEAEFVEI